MGRDVSCGGERSYDYYYYYYYCKRKGKHFLFRSVCDTAFFPPLNELVSGPSITNKHLMMVSDDKFTHLNLAPG